MTMARPKIVNAAWQMLPEPLRGKLRGNTGKRFVRFVPVSLAAVAASQITLAVLVGITKVSAGTSAIIASMVGAAVSYVLSRWAWERKGKPHLLKETLPFWLVSVGAWIVLGLASHYASVWAISIGASHWERVAIVNGAYFLTNCVTFVTRFAIFHYVLFANRGSKAVEVAADTPAGGPGLAAAGGEAGPGFISSNGAGRSNGAGQVNPAAGAGRGNGANRADHGEPFSFALAADRPAPPRARR
jgi:putative flippase GtrA